MSEFKSDCRVVAIANQKGGVGKTTTAVNLASFLNMKGVNTLLVDFDPQGNASSSFGITQKNIVTVFELIDNLAPIEKGIHKTKYGDIIPANLELVGSEIALVGRENRELVLKSVIDPLRPSYDVILIDCAPGLGLLMLNALCAADGVLIPLQCEYLALEGLTAMIDTIRMLKKRLNPKLDLDGLLFTMYDGRTKLSAQVVREVKKYFADKIYRTVIPRNVRLSEAPSHGKPIYYYDRYSRGTESYEALSEEFIKRNRLHKKHK